MTTETAGTATPPDSVRPWAAVLGVGAWMPGFPDARAFQTGVPTPGADAPPARLPPRLRRRASLLIRMVAEVAAQASEQSGISVGALPIVVGSAYGELATTMEMLHELYTERAVSPFRFHNSVHNTASGYLSIAHENRCPATSLAAGPETAPMALLEAMTLLADRGGDVLVVIADEALPESLTNPITTPVAAAMILRARPADDAARTALDRQALAWLGDLWRAPGAATSAFASATALASIPSPAPAAPAVPRTNDDESPGHAFLGLVTTALAARQPAGAHRVALTTGTAGGWSIAVTPSAREVT